MADFTIIEAGEADVPALALVGAATFLDGFAGRLDGPALVTHCGNHHTEAAYRTLLERGARAWIAQVQPGGAPVGYAVVSPSDLAQAEDGDLELKRIYLLSRYQGSGIAQALLEAALGGAGDASRLLLGVKDDNHRAIRFYEKQGFASIGTRQFDVGGRLYDDLVMARPMKATVA